MKSGLTTNFDVDGVGLQRKQLVLVAAFVEPCAKEYIEGASRSSARHKVTVVA